MSKQYKNELLLLGVIELKIEFESFHIYWNSNLIWLIFDFYNDAANIVYIISPFSDYVFVEAKQR